MKQWINGTTGWAAYTLSPPLSSTPLHFLSPIRLRHTTPPVPVTKNILKSITITLAHHHSRSYRFLLSTLLLLISQYIDATRPTPVNNNRMLCLANL